MADIVQSPDGAERTLIIDSGNLSLGSNIRAVWEYRELLYFIVWQQWVIRYKQTLAGLMWVIFEPLFSMLLLTLIFSLILRVVPGEGISYPIFLLTAMVFWRYLSGAIDQGSASVMINSSLISKVYFPRLIVPISGVLTPIIDFGLSFIILLVLLPFFDGDINQRILIVPFLFAYCAFISITVALWFSALKVRYRDVNYILPLILQVWFYISPILYPISFIPTELQPLYNINPMVIISEGARWALLGTDNLDFTGAAIGFVIICVLFVGGLIYFTRTERTFADLI